MEIKYPDRRGVLFAVLAAGLFGASTPASKILLRDLTPALLAGLLYLGSGLGLGFWRLFFSWRRSQKTQPRVTARELPWLIAVVLCGGVIAPWLCMWGLFRVDGSTAALLLNLEGVFTALLAWFVFRENYDHRIVLGMLLVVAGSVVLSWSGAPLLTMSAFSGPLAIAGACFFWGLDNNLMRKLSAADPVQIASIKGIVAGTTNTTIAFAMGAALPSVATVLLAGGVGMMSYGLSLVMFILALRHLGAARTGAYFSAAPFTGAALSIVLLGEPLTWPFLLAAALMAIGLLLHLTETHSHQHDHPFLEHNHRHEHDQIHQHEHPAGTDPRGPHSHLHAHSPTQHTHPHYPDIHHQHPH